MGEIRKSHVAPQKTRSYYTNSLIGLRSLGKRRMHTSLVSKRIYLKRRLLEQMKWKEEMKVRSTNVESAPPRKNKFATLAHQLVSLSMKFSAQKREKKTKTSFFKLYKSYIYSVPLDSRVKLVLPSGLIFWLPGPVLLLRE